MNSLKVDFFIEEKVNLQQANNEPRSAPRVSLTHFKVIPFILFIIVLFASFQYSKADCPDGYSKDSVEINFDGCVYKGIFCYGIDGLGYHELIIDSIKILAPRNDPSCAIWFEMNRGEITDAILIQIAQSPLAETIFGVPIPECPIQACGISIKDAICYSVWYFNKHINAWAMNICIENPVQLRYCDDVIYICYTWVNGVKVYSMERSGGSTGPACPAGCHTNCW